MNKHNHLWTGTGYTNPGRAEKLTFSGGVKPKQAEIQKCLNCTRRRCSGNCKEVHK